MSTIDLTGVFAVRVAETGAEWYRIEGGRWDGLWADDDGPSVPTSGQGMRTTDRLHELGTLTPIA